MLKFIRNRLILNKNKGQSLLELIVAIGIILACTIATLTLVITSIQAGRKGSDKIIATNLAREGIEIVRNIRDSNWISATSGIGSPSWDSGLVSGTDPTAIPVIDDTNLSSLEFAPNDFGDLCSSADCTKIYTTGTNYYIQNTNPSGTPTNFYRLLYLNPICRYENTSNPADPLNGDEKIFSQDSSGDCAVQFGSSYYQKVGIRVISEVHWPSPDKNKVILEDRLYNWRT